MTSRKSTVPGAAVSPARARKPLTPRQAAAKAKRLLQYGAAAEKPSDRYVVIDAAWQLLQNADRGKPRLMSFGVEFRARLEGFRPTKKAIDQMFDWVTRYLLPKISGR